MGRAHVARLNSWRLTIEVKYFRRLGMLPRLRAAEKTFHAAVPLDVVLRFAGC